MISALNIKHRLLVLIGLVVIGFSSLLVLAITQINEIRVGGALFETLENYDHMTIELSLLRADLSEVRALLTDSLYAADADQLKMMHRRVGELSNDVNVRFEKVQKTASHESVKAAVASARFTWDEFSKTDEEMFQSMLQGRRQFPRHILDMQRLRQDRFTEQIDSAINILLLEDKDLEEQSERSVARHIRVLVFGGSGLALLIMSLTLVIARSIAAPLRRLSDACSKMAAGNFTERVEIVGRDEIGTLANAFNYMSEQVRLRSESLDQAREESERRRRAAEALQAVSRDVAQSLDPATVGKRITESIRALLAVNSSALWRLEPESGTLIGVAASGDSDPIFGQDMALPKGTGLVSYAVREGRPAVSENLLADPRVVLTPEMRKRTEQTAFRALLAIPLVIQERVIGALAAGDREGRVFGQAEILLAQAFADQAAMAIENSRLYRESAERVTALEEALARVKQLQGLLPVCAWCKRVRKDQNYWQSVESYVADHSEIQFSHGICPECRGKVQTRRDSNG